MKRTRLWNTLLSFTCINSCMQVRVFGWGSIVMIDSIEKCVQTPSNKINSTEEITYNTFIVYCSQNNGNITWLVWIKIYLISWILYYYVLYFAVDYKWNWTLINMQQTEQYQYNTILLVLIWRAIWVRFLGYNI